MKDLLFDLRELAYNLVRADSKFGYYLYGLGGERVLFVSSIFFRCALRHGYSYSVSYDEDKCTFFIRFKEL